MFLGLQTGLFGASIIAINNYHLLISIFGIFVSIISYRFGKEDRYLVVLYRKQIKQAWNKVNINETFTDYCYIGQTEDLPTVKPIS